MDTDAIMREMQAAFRVEAEELVTDLEESLLQLESDNSDSALIDRVFRSLHTLKGSGSSSGFLKLAAFLHIFEDAFNLAREGKIEVTQSLIDLSLKTVDRITEYVQEEPGEAVDQAAIEADPILVELKKILPGSSNGTTKTDESVTEQSDSGSHTIYSIDFRPYENFMEFGNEPISVLDELRDLGPCVINAKGDIPPLSQFDPEKVYLSWRIHLYSESSYDDVEEIFSFVEMDADIDISESKRIPDTESNRAGLFDEYMLNGFIKEANELISAIPTLIDNDGEETQIDWEAVERKFHTLNGSCGLLLSTATSVLERDHPIVSLSHLCEALEDVIAKRIAPAGGAESLSETTKTALAQIEDLFLSFALGYTSQSVPTELLETLGIDPSHFSASEQSDKQVDSQQSAAQQIASQSLFMLETSLEKLSEDTLLAQQQIIDRAVENLRKVAIFSKQAELKLLCDRYANEAKNALSSGLPEYKSLLVSVIADLKKPAASQEKKEQSKPAKSTPSTASAEKAKTSLRVDEEKIDRLMRAVGELLVARGAFPLIAKNVADNHGLSAIAQELREAGGNVARLADELQNAVMSIRMRSLQGLFQRFPRMVRDVSKSLGKQINFVIEGEDTELDKSMVEQLGDPLVHILRNALDHGIETIEERQKTDKVEAATIKLGAYTEGTTVAIKIQDDGRGLDPNRLKKKAIEKGLISASEAETMPDNVAQELIMRPGFSTAESVTDLSGRGVGMDVVANNIRKLHGTIEIDSIFGKGTTFTLRLPTSLLVSEAILLRAGTEEYLIPTDNVASLEKMPLAAMRTHAGTRMMTIRGEVVNLVDLKELLSSEQPSEPTSELLNIALINTPEGRLGLIVDKFVSQEDIVVKPLSGNLSSIRIFSGVSIMGDGRVVPVINALEIHNFYLRRAKDRADELLSSPAR